jgi:hypothetical protein
VNIGHLFDRDEKGVTSGYLIGYINYEGEKLGVDYGRWQEDFEEFTKKQREAFETKYGKRELAKMSENQRAVLWHKFYDKKYNDWHKQNSVTVVQRNDKGDIVKWINMPHPSMAKYGSDKYDKLSTNEKEILD